MLLHKKLPISYFLFAFLTSTAFGSNGVLNVKDYGAQGDGIAIDSDAINAAIDAAAESGGGTVLLPAGDYLSYTLRLKSNTTLKIDAGATLIAAEPTSERGYDAPEPNPWNQYQDFGHSHFRNSLIWGEGLEGVSILGPGKIFGRGLSRGNGPHAAPYGSQPPPAIDGLLPDVLAADGDFEIPHRPDVVPGPFGHPNQRDTLAAGIANKAIALLNCRNVTMRDLSILHGGHFAIITTEVDNLTIDNLLIDTNRDGIDIDACQNVRISNTSVNSPWDDAICLKSSHALGRPRTTENVTITNCAVSGYDEGTLYDGTRKRTWKTRGGPHGRIKLGTEAGGGFRNITISNTTFDHCRGLAFEQVDGGVLEDITVSNITMRDVQNAPIFIRLGARLRNPDATGPGTVSRILIDNVTAWNVAPEHGIIIAGLSGHPIEDVVLSNLQFHYRGGGTAQQAQRVVPEYERDYPDPYNFGTMPSWGMFARHVKNLQLRGVEFRALSYDARPAILLEDVVGARFSDLQLSGDYHEKSWSMTDVSSFHARDASGLADGPQL
ncbi:right-handed parallel beta-helix repeat-containing protein [Pelagicoccus sp. NFK12]|uniref:Right-handed parallel beta-helix repeat-containing protein n=1 Tax=Pelagicoccus enzymogenes TaxID=2773457 RepID=A0A927F775_9BACT|nr:glycosyl hydrolase family 28-related protein [Pelagicoccus enzymogenes]MBD5779134.1 right-handed parallel beta-helix repeat-containing protein [Pelagicoccus enzymogenes]